MLGARRHDRIPVRTPTPARRARLYPPGDRRRGRSTRSRRRQVVPGYIGFDATAPSLHVGSLVQIMLLRRLQQAGHKPIVLMGGGTAQDRRSELQGRGAQAAHRRDDRRQHRLDPAGVRALPDVRRRPDRRDHGRQCRLARRARIHPLPARRRPAFLDQPDADLRFSVKLRLDREQSLTFLEFNYMILQAYDFLRAVAARRLPAADGRLGPMGQYRQRHRAGAADGRREVFGVTTPLITTADGGKMGKTAAGAVWLNADQLPPYDYWQFWRNTQDARRRAVPAPVHRSAARRDRAAGGAGGRGDQRRQEGARRRGDGDAARRRGRGRRRRKPRAGPSRKARRARICRRSRSTGEIGLVDALVGLGLVASKNEARRLIAAGRRADRRRGRRDDERSR